MQDTEPKTYIANPVEIAAHIDSLVLRRIRADLKVGGDEEAIRVIFLGHGGSGKDSHLLLERLVALGALNRLDIGKEVDVEYMEDGVGFYFKSRSIDFEDKDGCIRLGFPEQIVKSQKRRFFRVHPAPPPPLFEVVVNTETISAKCLVNDISAGGLAFTTDIGNELIKPGMGINLEFRLADGSLMKVKGIVRSCSLIESLLPKKKYRCGVEFIDMPESLRDRIVKHVFDLQKEEIKRRRER